MKELLSKNEIRQIFTKNGVSLSIQPNGDHDLDPQLYSAIDTAIERALRGVLISQSSNIRSITSQAPSSTLDRHQYNSPCRLYISDFQRLSKAMDKLQASLVQRQVNSTKLWNMSVVDKHGALIFGVTGSQLGAGMDMLIKGVEKHIRDLPTTNNAPFFTDPVEIPMVCGVIVEAESRSRALAVVETVKASQMYDSIHLDIPEPDYRLTMAHPLKGQYFILPVTSQCGYGHGTPAFNAVWEAMCVIGDVCGYGIVMEVTEGHSMRITVGNVGFIGSSDANVLHCANCYLASLVTSN